MHLVILDVVSSLIFGKGRREVADHLLLLLKKRIGNLYVESKPTTTEEVADSLWSIVEENYGNASGKQFMITKKVRNVWVGLWNGNIKGKNILRSNLTSRCEISKD